VTLLMLAGRKGYLDLYKELAQKGANTAATTTKGQTVLEYLEMCLEAETSKAESRGRVHGKTKKKLQSAAAVIEWHRFITGRPASAVGEKSLSASRAGSRTLDAVEDVADKAYDAVSTAASVAKKLWGQGDKALKSAGMQAFDAVINPVSTLKKTGGVGYTALFKTVQAARNPLATMNKTRNLVIGTAATTAATTANLVSRVANTGRALADMSSTTGAGASASRVGQANVAPASARARTPFRAAAALVASGSYPGSKVVALKQGDNAAPPKPDDSRPRPEWLVDEPTKKPARRKEAKPKPKTKVKTWLCSSCGEQNRGAKKECWSCHQAEGVEDDEYATDLSGLYEDKKKRRVPKAPKVARVKSISSAGVKSPPVSPRPGKRTSSKGSDGGKPAAKGARRPSVTKSEKRPDRTSSSSGKPRVNGGKPSPPAAAPRKGDE